LVCLSLFSESCFLARKKVVPPPAPTAPADLPPKPVSPPVQSPGDVKIETPPAAEPEPQQLPTFPKPAPRQAQKDVETPPAPSEPIGPKPTDVPKVDPPKLSPMLSNSEQRDLAAAIYDLLGRTERNISTAKSLNLNPQQKELVRQAENFLAQARAVREHDLPAARSLAERALLLSTEALK
jgi:hypothetical protein